MSKGLSATLFGLRLCSGQSSISARAVRSENVPAQTVLGLLTGVVKEAWTFKWTQTFKRTQQEQESKYNLSGHAHALRSAHCTTPAALCESAKACTPRQQGRAHAYVETFWATRVGYRQTYLMQVPWALQCSSGPAMRRVAPVCAPMVYLVLSWSSSDPDTFPTVPKQLGPRGRKSSAPLSNEAYAL